jgi:hypothetical protein
MSDMSNSFETGSVETGSLQTHALKIKSNKLDTDGQKSADSSAQPVPNSAESTYSEPLITGRSPQATSQATTSIPVASEAKLEKTMGTQSHQGKRTSAPEPDDSDDEINNDQQNNQQSEAIDLREPIDPEIAETDKNTEADAEIDDHTDRSPLRRGAISVLLVFMAVGALAAAVNFAIFLLVNPKSLSVFIAQEGQSCKTKINGQWQTNWGKIAFAEQPNSNLVTGEYTYQNLNRGKVEGTLEGQLAGDTLNFDWQETAQRGQKSVQGQGSFLFVNNCQNFSGSYGLEQAQSGWGNWSGQVLEVVPISQ